MTLTPAWEIQTTLPNEDSANALAKNLVESKLAACVQISGPIRSVYTWKNEIQSESEWTLRIKTIEPLLDQCNSRLAELHSYEVPEIIANPILRISDSYHRWLIDELAPKTFTESSRIEPWHLQIQTLANDAVKLEEALRLPSHGWSQTCDQWSLPSGPRPLKVTFEAIAEELAPWPGMYFEMDGSFVWVSPNRDDSSKPLWQLDGMIYDRNNEVQYVELKGYCDHAAWIKLVSVFGDNAITNDPNSNRGSLAIHLIKQSTWILESDFRKTVS